MNTWRDIKTDPPRPDQPVYVTDGISVCIGRIRKPDAPADWETFTFDGYNIPEGYPLQGDISLFNITEWQPTPDTWKPEKTADEMFRELGYKQIPQCPGVYEEGEYHPSRRFTRICVGKASVYKDLVFPAGSTHDEPFSPSEILACAQLIREMEANHETD